MKRISISSASAVAAVAITTLFAGTLPAHAAVEGTVIIQSGPQLQYRNLPPPPPPRLVNRPHARSGQVWVDGHWEWRGTQYRWADGYWLQARRGYAYQQPQWVQRNGEWTYVRGDWRRGNVRGMRDRDHDGIADRYDNDRDNDGLRNDRDRDRDGDGVRNRNDRFPNNPRRH